MATPKTTKKTSGPAAAKKTVTKAKAPAEKAAAGALEAAVYSKDGKEVSKVSLPASVFGAKWRADLVHQVVTGMQANLRQNRAHTKDRAEVAGGGRKPWKQKGTGQARHGSTRSPIWRHGGVTFGPRNERDYGEKINKKMRVQALASVLSKKVADGEVIFVDSLGLAAPKTADAKKLIAALAKGAGVAELATKKKNAALIALSSYDAGAVKSFRNLGQLMTEEVRNLNPLDLVTYRYLIIENPETSVAQLANRLSK